MLIYPSIGNRARILARCTFKYHEIHAKTTHNAEQGLVRHGARNPGPGDIKMMKNLEALLGKLCRTDNDGVLCAIDVVRFMLHIWPIYCGSHFSMRHD